MPIRNICLTFGYAEGIMVAPLIFGAEVPCKTKKEALDSLVEFLYLKYQQDYPEMFNKKTHSDCCDPYIGEESYCPKCGTNIKDREFSWDHWMSALTHLQQTDIDGYGYHDTVENPNEWSPWSWKAESKGWVIVRENAEYILSIVLAKLHPELKNKDMYQSVPYSKELYIKEYNSIIGKIKQDE